jgi:hypothetical protein
LLIFYFFNLDVLCCHIIDLRQISLNWFSVSSITPTLAFVTEFSDLFPKKGGQGTSLSYNHF